MIPAAYTPASRSAMRRPRAAPRLKYETVIGTMGNTHGVSSDSAPIVAAIQRNNPIEPSPEIGGGVCAEAEIAGDVSATVSLLAFHSAEFEAAPTKRTSIPNVSLIGGRQYRSVHAW